MVLIGRMGWEAIRRMGWRPRAVGGLTMGADPVAYAIAAASRGTELEVETPNESTSAVVARKPFIDPEKEIPKQDIAARAAAKDNSAGS